ncbi:ankyrin repeat protein, partial [Teladorsagia circumcincta]
YLFGYAAELKNRVEVSGSTAKRLRKRLQRQQSGQSGRRHTGESSEGSSLVGTPTDTGRSFTFGAAQRIMRDREDGRPVSSQNLTEAMLEAIHCEDANLIERLLAAYNLNQPISASPSIGSTNTLTELAQRRHGAGTHRRSNASSTMSTHSNCRTPSMTPELCSTCSQLRVVPITDQTPLGVAVRAQSSELIALLIAYGADVNLARARQLPQLLHLDEFPLINISAEGALRIGLWHHRFSHILIEQRNMRGICPLDLAPELKKLQHTCVKELLKIACTGDNELSNKSTSAGPALRHWSRLHVDIGN